VSRQQKREPRVVFGFHAILARLRADPSSVVELFVDESRNDARIRDLATTAERAFFSFLTSCPCPHPNTIIRMSDMMTYQ